MIAVGEEANNLEQVLIDMADTLERQTNRTLDLFVRMLEPVMLTVLAGIVLFVVSPCCCRFCKARLSSETKCHGSRSPVRDESPQGNSSNQTRASSPQRKDVRHANLPSAESSLGGPSRRDPPASPPVAAASR